MLDFNLQCKLGLNLSTQCVKMVHYIFKLQASVSCPQQTHFKYIVRLLIRKEMTRMNQNHYNSLNQLHSVSESFHKLLFQRFSFAVKKKGFLKKIIFHKKGKKGKLSLGVTLYLTFFPKQAEINFSFLG